MTRAAARAKLGTKHFCSCGTRWYDLGGKQHRCPRCGQPPGTPAAVTVVLNPQPPSTDTTLPRPAETTGDDDDERDVMPWEQDGDAGPIDFSAELEALDDEANGDDEQDDETLDGPR